MFLLLTTISWHCQYLNYSSVLTVTDSDQGHMVTHIGPHCTRVICAETQKHNVILEPAGCMLHANYSGHESVYQYNFSLSNGFNFHCNSEQCKLAAIPNASAVLETGGDDGERSSFSCTS